jgi:hypothetical protein
MTFLATTTLLLTAATAFVPIVGMLFAPLLLGLFLLALLGVFSSQRDRRVRPRNPKLDGRSWRDE